MEPFAWRDEKLSFVYRDDLASDEFDMSASHRTFSNAHVQAQQTRHRMVDGYGRHHHDYLPQRIKAIAGDLATSRPDGVRWLDYGCGKGTFIEQVRPLGLFETITGYDPAVTAFSARPVGPFDLVTCLDVIDIVEPRFRDAVIADVGRLSAGLALFDVMTRPRSLPPHPPFHWVLQIKRHMHVVETWVEFGGMSGMERALTLARPAPSSSSG